MNMLNNLPPEQQHYVLAHVNSADGHVDGAHGRVDDARGQVCKQCSGLKAGPIGINKGCTCCSCDGCDACSNKGVKIHLKPEKCGVDRIGRTTPSKIITKCENCNRLARQSDTARRSSDLRRLKDMEAKAIAVAVENVDIAQQRPAATLGDTTQLAVQLAEQLCSIAPASSLPAASVQPPGSGDAALIPICKKARVTFPAVSAAHANQLNAQPADGAEPPTVVRQTARLSLVPTHAGQPLTHRVGDNHQAKLLAFTSGGAGDDGAGDGGGVGDDGAALVTLKFEERGAEEQPWGPLRKPAAPPDAEPLSNDEVNRHLERSVLRNGCMFEPQSYVFDEVDNLPAARIRIWMILPASMPGAIKYVVRNIGSTNQALLGLLKKVTWNGQHMGKLTNSQRDGRRRFMSFDAMLQYFEALEDAAALALCQTVVFRLKMVVTLLLIGFQLPPIPHKLGIMLTEWGATDQKWHDDSLGVSDTYSSVLALIDRGVDLSREDDAVHTMCMAAGGNDAEGCIFESPLIHRGKGAPEPPLGKRTAAKLPGFTMPSDGSHAAKLMMIQSAALHFYGGKNACRIPLSDKYASLSHHTDMDL